MSKPSGIFEVQQRVNFNLTYFSSNYILITAIICCYCILTNLLLFFILAADTLVVYLTQLLFKNSDELQFRSFKLSKSAIYSTLLLINLPLLFVANPFTTLIWLATASAAVVLPHAVFMEKPLDASFAEVV
ncbi:hypothetical protein KL921_001551 [Ogataea angusta]|uniref:PRA1 family protein n=1 Tax=Pichia angusta TaxID=870730 RepID=A0AAN6DGY5_PICAN|nr:uncharacterized protein KL928_002787 [Ogataea angusta]KAG7812319.1 hypothetical protein KL921_001551 [Ogataea angusta]KAG7818919.1 hypothetical protein KL928_002787 [Ogataea angusta]KAG7825166.1 hypothetical protein KL909_001458 [Ogataea angusta]KAG7830353.1 hypothetical protein KL920_001991 [Ogataea angusta]KAG7841542.1 hypothetical protein KL942_001421 [Ogataea angusta]